MTRVQLSQQATCCSPAAAERVALSSTGWQPASRSPPGGLLGPTGRNSTRRPRWQTRIVDLVPLALAAIKRFVTEHILPKGPSELAARFNAKLSAVRNSKDAAEGVRAFKERRRPQYKGR